MCHDPIPFPVKHASPLLWKSDNMQHVIEMWLGKQKLACLSIFTAVTSREGDICPTESERKQQIKL